MSVAVLVLGGRSAQRQLEIIFCSKHPVMERVANQDGLRESLRTVPKGGLPTLHGNTASGSVSHSVLEITAFLGHRFAWALF